MVHLISTLAFTAATLATLGQSSVFYLVTQRLTNKGKLTFAQDLLTIYDVETTQLCSPGRSDSGSCSSTPKGSEVSACDFKYSGSNPWGYVIGDFYNRSSPYVNDGLITVGKTAGGSFQYNVTKDSHCSKIGCSVNNGDSTITYQGFRCVNSGING